jgi:hypothetical protein
MSFVDIMTCGQRTTASNGRCSQKPEKVEKTPKPKAAERLKVTAECWF